MLPVMPTVECKPLVWALNHMTVTQDETDKHGYIYRAEITINTAMVHAIRQYIIKHKTMVQDSKKGITYSIKFLNDAATEQEAYISISPKNVVSYAYTAPIKP